jgi:hypothetical protein
VYGNCRLVIEIQEPIQGHCETHGQMLQNYSEKSEDSKEIKDSDVNIEYCVRKTVIILL